MLPQLWILLWRRGSGSDAPPPTQAGYATTPPLSGRSDDKHFFPTPNGGSQLLHATDLSAPPLIRSGSSYGGLDLVVVRLDPVVEVRREARPLWHGHNGNRLNGPRRQARWATRLTRLSGDMEGYFTTNTSANRLSEVVLPTTSVKAK